MLPPAWVPLPYCIIVQHRGIRLVRRFDRAIGASIKPGDGALLFPGSHFPLKLAIVQLAGVRLAVLGIFHVVDVLGRCVRRIWVEIQMVAVQVCCFPVCIWMNVTSADVRI